MNINQKVTGTSKPFPAGLAAGLAVSVGATVVMCTMLTMLILNGKMTWERMGYGLLLTLWLSSFAGTYAANRLIKRRKLLVCGWMWVLCSSVLLVIDKIAFGGGYSAFPTAVCVIAGGCILTMFVQGKWGDKRKKWRKR